MQTSSPRTWDWPSAGLLIALALTASVRLAATGWTSNLYFGENMAVAGACLGLWIGYAKFSKRATRLLILNYTLVIVPWQLSLLAPEILGFSEKFISLGPRFAAAWSAMIEKQPFEDPILFISIITLGLWLVGLASGFALARRRDLLTAVLPSGLVLLIVQFYDSEAALRFWLLAVHLFLSLALTGRMYFLDNHQAWRERRVFQIPETARDLSNGLLVTSALVVLVAWSMPVSISSLKSAEKFWKDLIRPLSPLEERVSDALDPLESPYGRGGRSEFYGESLLLGKGLLLSEDIMFTVQTPQNINNAPPRFYWRGRVFSTFDGVTWVNLNTVKQGYKAGLDIPPAAEFAGLETASFKIKLAVEQSLIFAPSQPISSDHTGLLIFNQLPQGAREIIAFEASPKIEPRETYEVRAALVNPSIEELRSAGTNYPAWVTARYLQLPENFSPRIADLAKRITEGEVTPYNKTAAITAWLRNEIEYEAVIPTTPQGKNPLEWMLFEYKRGFCMYYASAEVLMLRSLGIPARLAVGFAQGELSEDQRDEQTFTYIVRRADYHAWPEVYFPDIGWVEFEPTASQDALTRPLTTSLLPSAPEAASPTNPIATPEGGLSEFERVKDETDLANVAAIPWYVTYRRALNWMLAILILFVLWLLNLRSNWVTKIPLYLEARAARAGTHVPRWVRAWAAWTRLSPMERSFEAVNVSLRSFGERMPVHASAGERAKRLIGLLPAAHTQVQRLTERHEAALFGRGGASDLPQRGAVLRGARRAASSILLHTFWARLIKWWQSILDFIGL